MGPVECDKPEQFWRQDAESGLVQNFPDSVSPTRYSVCFHLLVAFFTGKHLFHISRHIWDGVTVVLLFCDFGNMWNSVLLLSYPAEQLLKHCKRRYSHCECPLHT